MEMNEIPQILKKKNYFYTKDILKYGYLFFFFKKIYI